MQVTFDCGHTQKVSHLGGPWKMPEVTQKGICWGMGCLCYRTIVAIGEPMPKQQELAS